MNTADYALIISLCSAGIALASFVWNIWSKFIYPKPKIDVAFSRMTTVKWSGESDHPILVLSATNMGPSEATLYAAVICKRWRWQRKTVGFINPLKDFPSKKTDSDGPFSGGLPKKLAVGETFDVYFPVSVDWNISEHPYIGFRDTFRRMHLTKILLRRSSDGTLRHTTDKRDEEIPISHAKTI